MRFKYLHIIALLIGIFFCGCTEDKVCLIPQDIALQMTFYSDSVNTDGNRVEYTHAIDSLWLKGVGNDSIIYENEKNIQSVNLTLKNNDTITQYALTINTIQDTITIYHQNNDIFVSLECGCYTYYTIDSLTETAHLFDSIDYVNREKGRKTTENLRIFW